MSIASTTKTRTKRRLTEMSPEEWHAAALADPDAQPIRPEDMPRMRRVVHVIHIRRMLKLSQEEFAQQFQIPIGTLRDWEQRRKEPDAAARAYLKVIARAPDAVRQALKRPPMPAEPARAKTPA